MATYSEAFETLLPLVKDTWKGSLVVTHHYAHDDYSVSVDVPELCIHGRIFLDLWRDSDGEQVYVIYEPTYELESIARTQQEIRRYITKGINRLRRDEGE